MRLSQLVAELAAAESLGPDVDISAICYDSRRAGPGALFVAVPGSSKDGLVHISKLGFGQRIEKVEGAYNIGDEIEVEVQKVDEALGKISLSPINPETSERYDGPERKPRDVLDIGKRFDLLLPLKLVKSE